MTRSLLLAALLSLAACGASAPSDLSSGDGGIPDGAATQAGDAGADAATSGPDAAGAGPDAGPITPAQKKLLADRPYALTVPNGYDGSRAVPFVLLLHGYTGSGAIQDSYFKLSALAEAKTFLVAAPDGTIDNGGNRFWNAFNVCCNFYNSPVDDVAYLTAILDDVQSRYRIDAKRIFVMGHSNGGAMAHRLGCELSSRIAGFVSLAGPVPKDMDAVCKPTSPIAVLQVHGDADTTIVYTGGTVYPGVPEYDSAPSALGGWATRNRCAPNVTAGARLDLETNLAGAETEVAIHGSCAQGGAAELWTMKGAGHIPSFNATWASTIYGFLMAHPRP